MQKIIVDNRMPKVIKEYFKSLGYIVIDLPKQENIYDEISSHVDIFFTKIDDFLVFAKNVKIDELDLNKYIKGDSIVGKSYPHDTPYNVCILGKTCICNFKNTDKKVIKLLNECNYNVINVRQGYTKCSIAKTSENSCITTDKGIYNTLLKENIDCLYIEENNIKLMKEGKFSEMKGFIGGATTLLGNNFYVFGDSDNLENKEKILEHLKKYNLNLIDFKGLEILDCGGIMEV